MGRPIVLPALRLVVLFTAMLVSLAAGYSIGRVQHKVGVAVAVVGENLNANLHNARTALGLDPAAAQPAPAQPMFVGERAYPSRVPSVEVSKPAPRLPGEAKFGQVTLDCQLDTVSTHPACKITDIRGADAFSASAVVWLQGLAIRYGQSLRAGVPISLAHRWRVVFDDFSGTTLPAKAAK